MSGPRIVDLGDGDGPAPPGGKPIPGVSNHDDVRWALDKARRYIFKGGDRTDPRYREYLDAWLDYRNELAVAALPGTAGSE